MSRLKSMSGREVRLELAAYSTRQIGGGRAGGQTSKSGYNIYTHQ